MKCKYMVQACLMNYGTAKCDGEISTTKCCKPIDKHFDFGLWLEDNMMKGHENGLWLTNVWRNSNGQWGLTFSTPKDKDLKFVSDTKLAVCDRYERMKEELLSAEYKIIFKYDVSDPNIFEIRYDSYITTTIGLKEAINNFHNQKFNDSYKNIMICMVYKNGEFIKI